MSHKLWRAMDFWMLVRLTWCVLFYSAFFEFSPEEKFQLFFLADKPDWGPFEDYLDLSKVKSVNSDRIWAELNQVLCISFFITYIFENNNSPERYWSLYSSYSSVSNCILMNFSLIELVNLPGEVFYNRS